jgi:ankyrin repeat protein
LLLLAQASDTVLDAGAASREPDDELNDADVEALNDALWFAAADGDLERFQRLLAQGADPDGKPAGVPATALWIAAQEGHVDLVRFLVGLGADVDGRDATDQRTALFQAAQEGHAEIVAILLEAGAAIEAASARTGATALFIAAARGHIDAVRVLVDAGADLDARAVAGDHEDTPLSIARSRDFDEVARLIEAAANSRGGELRE